MSNQDIQIICELLLGISNTNNEIRTISVNKLQELTNKNFDKLLFCLLEIIEKISTKSDNNQNLLKTTSLVICRKIIENIDYITWKKINKELKLKIKYKLLNLLNNELSPKDNLKICDVIIELLGKIFECEGVWSEILKLVMNILNYDPNEGDKNSFQIISLLYIIKGGINFLYNFLSKNLDKFLKYLEKIFNSLNIDIKAKILAGELVYEFISFVKCTDLEKIKLLIKHILISLYDSYQLFEKNKQNEKNVKYFLKILIDIESIEPSLLEIYFQDIFNLTKEIILNKKFDDQKIREMGFELIISLIEDKPLLINDSNITQILLTLIELILNYALEFDKNININADDIYFDYNDNLSIENFVEEEINFGLSLLERLFENIKNKNIENIFKTIVDSYIHNSWKHQYVILLSLNIFCDFNKDTAFIQQYYEYIINLGYSSENKVRFSSLYCITNLIKIYNPIFLSQNITKILAMIIHLLKNENNSKCKFLILNCLKRIIHYNDSKEFYKNIEIIFGLLMDSFTGENNSVFIRKLIILNIIELNNKRKEEKINTILNKIDINSLMNYFINLYNKQIDVDLYDVLLEIIVLIGVGSPDKINKILPIILSYIIQIIKDFEYDNKNEKKNVSICEITKSLKKILPIIIKKNENINLLFELINNIISLIKLKNISSINCLTDIDFEITDLFNEKNNSDITYQNIYNSQMEEFSCLLTILLTILNPIEKIKINIEPYFLSIENEILPLINYRLYKKIRNKSSKVLTKLIFLMPNNEQKKVKSLSYMHIMINAIEKETDALITKNFFERIKEIIDYNNNEFLDRDEINKLFNKFYIFNDNLTIKRNQMIKKQENLTGNLMNIKNKEESLDKKYMNELIKNEIENIENIQIEICDVIGILFKTHKNKCEQIIEQIINNIIPSYLNSKDNFKIKISLYLIDDLIEYIGQEKLGNIFWEIIYNIIIRYILNEDNSIRQAAAYGIGIFSLHTKNDFIKYGQGLLENLYNALSLSINIKNNNKIDNKEDFLISFDNIVAALGKIIHYQFNSEIVEDRINELIEKWLMNLPIKYDESEKELQHEWMTNLFFFKRDLIPMNCYSHYFESLAEIYRTKYSSQKIDNQIEVIFTNFVKKEEELRIILAKIYENSSNDIKNKFNILANLKA